MSSREYAHPLIGLETSCESGKVQRRRNLCTIDARRAEVTYWSMDGTDEVAAAKESGVTERRAGRRAKVERKLLVRASEPPFGEEVKATSNVSRRGVYFVTLSRLYYTGMRVNLISGYAPNDPCNSVSVGEVVRIDKLKDGKSGIAVRILLA